MKERERERERELMTLSVEHVDHCQAQMDVRQGCGRDFDIECRGALGFRVRMAA